MNSFFQMASRRHSVLPDDMKMQLSDSLMDAEKMSLDERKFVHEVETRKKELSLKEREIVAKETELHRSRWLNPTAIGLFAAATGLAGNVIVGGYNNHIAQKMERMRAQSGLIVQAISTGNAETACRNLLWFITLGLLDDTNGTIRQCSSSPLTVPFLPVRAKTYIPAVDTVIRTIEMGTVVERVDLGDTYRFNVAFTVPARDPLKLKGETVSFIRIYAHKVTKQDKLTETVVFPNVEGKWKVGERATFSVILPKTYVDDHENHAQLRYCVGSPDVCDPSSDLLLPESE